MTLHGGRLKNSDHSERSPLSRNEARIIYIFVYNILVYKVFAYFQEIRNLRIRFKPISCRFKLRVLESLVKDPQK